MASANVELVRSIYAAWGRGDFTSVSWAHPEVEFTSADGLLRSTRVGVGPMTEGWTGFLSAWSGLTVEPDEFRELDDERVLVLARFRGRGKASGLQVVDIWPSAASLFEIRGGLVTNLVLWTDSTRALAVLGLAPGGTEGRSRLGSRKR